MVEPGKNRYSLPMTPDQIHLLRRSFAKLEPHATVAALAFYRRLFELAPQVRPLFKTEIESQSAKLMAMIGLAVSLTDRPANLEGELRELGARHLDYGTQDEHYAVVGAALLDMLAEVLGNDFTPATKAAWAEFFELISKKMLEGAAAARVDRGWKDPGSAKVPKPGN
jgi:hemoglobin-like flavoprotein